MSNNTVASGIDLSRGPLSMLSTVVDQEILPPVGVERDTFVQQARDDINRINDVMKTISSVFNIEPIFIELMKEEEEKLKTNEELLQEAHDALESMFCNDNRSSRDKIMFSFLFQ